MTEKTKFATFDLEIAKELPEGVTDWKAYAPLGITCAAVALEERETQFWHSPGRLSQTRAAELVSALQALVADGYQLVTWNGCSFDFSVLAEESGLRTACTELALHHVDLMMIVTFIKGYYLGLDKALVGAGIPGKVKTLQLQDGTRIQDMNGKLAPTLWAKGEYDAVLTYLRGDVEQLLQLAQHVQRVKTIRWTSNRGTPQQAAVPHLYTVKECFSIPTPDTTWMSHAPRREDFVRWMGIPARD